MFSILYIVIDVFSHLDEIVTNKTNISLLLSYYLNFLPLIFVQVASFACLLGCLYTLGILNRNNEIIALRNSGLSIFRITKPLIIFACLISAAVFVVNDKFVPASELTKQNIETQIEQNKIQDQKTITHLSIYGVKNRLFFIDKFIVSENKLEGITILEQDDFNILRKKITASEGIYKNGLWRFYGCRTYFYDKDNRLNGDPAYFPEQVMSITETPEDFLKQLQKPEFMSIAHLKDYIKKLSHGNANPEVKKFQVELYLRFFMPLTSLIILIVGIPFSFVMKRRATGLFSIGIAIMIGFLYYVVNAISVAFGKGGFFPPLFAVSFSHIIFFSLGIYHINRLN